MRKITDVHEYEDGLMDENERQDFLQELWYDDDLREEVTTHIEQVSKKESFYQKGKNNEL